MLTWSRSADRAPLNFIGSVSGAGDADFDNHWRWVSQPAAFVYFGQSPRLLLKKFFFSFTHEQNQLIVSKRHSWTLTPVFSFRDIYELLMFYSLAEGLTIICSDLSHQFSPKQLFLLWVKSKPMWTLQLWLTVGAAVERSLSGCRFSACMLKCLWAKHSFPHSFLVGLLV